MNPSSPLRPALLALLLLQSTIAACDGATGADGDGSDGGNTGTTGTTGTTDPGEQYEEGCILVDGGGGYAWITDAIAVASEGSTIELCASGTHEESVVVDKAVSIVGPGPDALIVSAPTNEVPFTITASGASLSGVSVDSTRSGIVVAADAGQSAATGIQISDVHVVGADNWGISVENADDVTISDVDLLGNGYGGLSVDSAGVLISDSLVQSNLGYGIFATGGAEVELVNNQVITNQPTSEDEITDGHGIYGTDGASLTLTDNVVSNNVFVNVFADGADVVVSGGAIEAGLYGVAAIEGAVDIADVSISDGYFHGILAITSFPVSLSNLEVSGDPSLTAQGAATEWNVADEDGNADRTGAGLFIASDEIVLSDSTITGYNHAGALLQPLDAGTATIARTDFVDNGQHGLYVVLSETTLEDVNIEGVREIEEQPDDTACLTIDTFGGAIFVENTVRWTTGTLQANGGYGVAGIRAALVLDDLTVASNVCAGVMDFGGSMSLTGSDFSDSVPRDIVNQWIASSVVDYQSTGAVISGNVFHDAQRSRERSGGVTDYGDYTVEYIYYDTAGSDLVVFESGPSELTGNTFSTGTGGTQFVTTPATVSENTWTNYLSTPLYTSGEATMEVTDNTFTGVAGAAVSCSQGRVSLEDNVFQDGEVYQYTVERLVDGELDYDYQSSFIGQMLNLSSCSASLEGDSLSNYPSNAIYSYTSSDQTVSIELIDVTLDSYNQDEDYDYYAGIQVYTYYGSTDIYIENSELTGGGGDHAIEVYNDFSSDYYEGLASLSLVDTLVESAGNAGLYTTGDGVTVNVSGSLIEASSGDGIAVDYGAVAISDTDITTSGDDGIALRGSVLTVDETLPSSSTMNTSYGLSCDASSEVVGCSALDLSSNTAGEHSGCEAWCDSEL